ncbi:MAG: class I SAM-dependent methyltransferase [Archaeoglobaceae archaeon]
MISSSFLKTLTQKLFGEKIFGTYIYHITIVGQKHPRYEEMLRDTYNALEIEKFTAGNFLDAGCGNGSFMIYALKLNPYIKFYGFDLSEKGLKLVRKKRKRMIVSI